MGIISRFPGGGGGSGKTSIVNAVVTLPDTTLTYNGSVQTQAITSVVLNGVTLTENDDFTVSGNAATNAGAHSITLTGINNFEGTKTVPWTMAKAAGVVSLNPTTLTLGANSQTGTIAVTRSGDGVVSASVNNSAASVSVSGITVTVTCQSSVAATAVVTVSVAAGTNHNAASATCAVNIVYTTAYGARWDYTNSSSALTRLGASASFVDPVPAVGTGSGSSPFDNCMPWSGIRVCNVVAGVVTAYQGNAGFSYETADVMVEIPKFWYKSTDNPTTNIREYWIANGAVDGYDVHPAFIRGGEEKDYIYVGRYTTSGTANAQTSKSGTGVVNLVNTTRAAFRGSSATTGARAKGTGWSQWDIATWNAIQMLYLLEFADFNSQAKVGRGCCDDNAAPLAPGATNDMTYHTGRPAGQDGKTAVQYRGIENLWGNLWQLVDGCNFNNGTQYFCTNQSLFADDTASGYTQSSYNITSTSSAYISALGFDALQPWLQAPTAAAGSETEYITDAYWYATGWRSFRVGGRWTNASYCGMFSWYTAHASSYSGTDNCSRLLCTNL